jgi:hypothetical protein
VPPSIKLKLMGLLLRQLERLDPRGSQDGGDPFDDASQISHGCSSLSTPKTGLENPTKQEDFP